MPDGVQGGPYDLSTYEGRQEARDNNPGAIVDASSIYFPGSGQQYGGGGGMQLGSLGGAGGGSALGGGINSFLGVLGSGNKAAFDEMVREFNATFGLQESGVTGTYKGQPTQQALAQYAQYLGTYGAGGPQTMQGEAQAANLAAQQAGLTGYYQQPVSMGPVTWDQLSGMMKTAAGDNYNDAAAKQMAFMMQGNQTGNQPINATSEQLNAIINAGTGGKFQTAASLMGQPAPQMTTAYQQQIYNQQLQAIQTAANLQANPFRQQQAIGQLGRILGGQPAASFSAPNTVAGVGTAGGTGPNTGMAYMQQIIDDIRNPGANQASVQGVLDAIPTPNKINSQDFLRSAPSTQGMILQGMQEKYGLDPNDSLAQIKNTLPSFTAPTTFGQIKG